MSTAILVEITLIAVGFLGAGIGAILRIVLRTETRLPVIEQRLDEHDRRIGKLESQN